MLGHRATREAPRTQRSQTPRHRRHLVGRDLHPLTHLVQAMRKTRQTSEFIEKMGPFFVGWVLGTSNGE